MCEHIQPIWSPSSYHICKATKRPQDMRHCVFLHLPDDTVNDEIYMRKIRIVQYEWSVTVYLRQYPHSFICTPTNICTKLAHNHIRHVLFNSFIKVLLKPRIVHTHVHTHQHLWTNNATQHFFLPIFSPWNVECIQRHFGIVGWYATISNWKWMWSFSSQKLNQSCNMFEICVQMVLIILINCIFLLVVPRKIRVLFVYEVVKISILLVYQKYEAISHGKEPIYQF